jgi:integrase
VWTAKQLVYFLDLVRDDRQHAMWSIAALRGPRRSELCGLRWSDLDLDLNHHTLTVAQQITSIGGKLFISPPKSRASRRTIALDAHSVPEFQTASARTTQRGGCSPTRRTRMARQRIRVHPPRRDPLNPNTVTYGFRRHLARPGLPPVRLHELRHGAATLPTPPEQTSKPSRTNSATPASFSLPTPTPP